MATKVYKPKRKISATESEEIKIPASSVDGLSTVATSGSYNDLKDKPSLDCFCTTYTYKFSGDGSKKIFDIPHTLGEDVNVQVFLVGQQINSIDVDELVLVNTYTKKNLAVSCIILFNENSFPKTIFLLYIMSYLHGHDI